MNPNTPITINTPKTAELPSSTPRPSENPGLIQQIAARIKNLLKSPSKAESSEGEEVPPAIHTLEIEGPTVKLSQPRLAKDGPQTTIVIAVNDYHTNIGEIAFCRPGEWAIRFFPQHVSQQKIDEAIQLANKHFPNPRDLFES